MALFKTVYDAVDAIRQTFGFPVGGPPIATVSRAVIDVNGNPVIVGDSNGNASFQAPKVVTTQNGLTALAGGGQTGATPITADIAVVSTVATAADSVLLPAAKAGRNVFVKNTSANSLNVFPATGDAINALSANTAFALATVKSALFVCAVNGTWQTLLTA